MNLAAQPHHDGSPDYLDRVAPAIGDTVGLRLRVPDAIGVTAVHVRTVDDGEPGYRPARRLDDRDEPGVTWWQVDLPVTRDDISYRFLLQTTDGIRWVNGAGSFDRDVADRDDFRLVTYAPPPSWLADAVCYQIFPDRFARGSAAPTPRPDHTTADWAIEADWDTPVLADGRRAVYQLYRGDLQGVTEHLDHLEALGVNLVYLTPVFPARSSHRYDANTFDHVDPILGGDAALATLVGEAHARGMRVVGDLTTNHSGSHHEWFAAARADHAAPEAGFYYFNAHPDDYVGWFGLRSLPKFDLRSDGLRRRLVAGDSSIVRRWLDAGLDGWRIDVANMTGRHGAIDVNHEVGRDIRATMAAVGGDRWLVAEHVYDATDDLSGDGWHGVMSYTWFTRPVWRWLARPGSALMGTPGGTPDIGGGGLVESFRALTAGVPWRSVTASMTLLDSHDTARFASMARSPAAHRVALGLLLTLPGVPMVFAGDEVGVEGASPDLGRQPFPWDESTWDRDLLEHTRALIALRRGSRALREGSLRWVAATDDLVAFVREAGGDRVLVLATRAAHTTVELDARAAGLTDPAQTLFGGTDLDRDGDVVRLAAADAEVHVWRLGRE